MLRAVYGDGEPFSCGESGGLLREGRYEAFLCQGAGSKLEDQCPHLGESAVGERAHLADCPSDWAVRRELGAVHGQLRGSCVQRHGEQRLGDRVVEVSGKSLAFLTGRSRAFGAHQTGVLHTDRGLGGHCREELDLVLGRAPSEWETDVETALQGPRSSQRKGQDPFPGGVTNRRMQVGQVGVGQERCASVWNEHAPAGFDGCSERRQVGPRGWASLGPVVQERVLVAGRHAVRGHDGQPWAIGVEYVRDGSGRRAGRHDRLYEAAESCLLRLVDGQGGRNRGQRGETALQKLYAGGFAGGLPERGDDARCSPPAERRGTQFYGTDVTVPVNKPDPHGPGGVDGRGQDGTRARSVVGMHAR